MRQCYTFEEPSCSIPETMTRSLRTIHRHYCEKLYVGTVFFLPNYTHKAHHSAEDACIYPLIARDVNVSGDQP